MRVCFVSRDAIYTQEKELIEAEADIVVGGFKSLGEVSYERELKEETDYFERLARLSKTTNSVVVCGCITDTKGFKRKSAVVAEKGKLLGISDTVHSMDSEVSVGASLRVYDTTKGRLGVVVAEDLYFPEVIQHLVSCGSEWIICLLSRMEHIHTAILRAYAYCYGVPLVMCAQNYGMIADPSGSIAFGSPSKPAIFAYTYHSEYRLIQTRKRGMQK